MKRPVGFEGRQLIKWHQGMSLIELMCVIAIIAIIAAIYVGVIARAFVHAKKTIGH